jgi:hypothetical protein
MQAIAPMVLLLLSKFRMPVSTSFLLLGLFATSSTAFIKVVQKSAYGFGIAFLLTLSFYSIIYRFFHHKIQGIESKGPYLILQTIATGGLWSVWLQQDMSNIAIYMKRQLAWYDLVLTLVSITCFIM